MHALIMFEFHLSSKACACRPCCAHDDHLLRYIHGTIQLEGVHLVCYCLDSKGTPPPLSSHTQHPNYTALDVIPHPYLSPCENQQPSERAPESGRGIILLINIYIRI